MTLRSTRKSKSLRPPGVRSVGCGGGWYGRNERALYRRKDAYSGKDIISIYSPEKPFRVYDQKIWWSDAWDSTSYGKDYDFSQPFFKQFGTLLQAVPVMALQNIESVNSDYCSNCSRNKDCYMVSAGFTNEKVFYANRALYCKDSLDFYLGEELELSYGNVNCSQGFRLFFSNDSENCRESYFLWGCKNCSYCFVCVNLYNKSYYIFNEPYSREEYERRLEEFILGSFDGIRKSADRFEKHRSIFPHRFAKIIHSHDVSGDNVRGSRNCRYCFNVFSDAENCKFVEWAGYGLKDAYDVEGVGDNTSLLYENVMTERLSRGYFVTAVNDSHDVAYCLYCFSSHHLFGCIGLRNRSYCILNKQYTQEEYEKLLTRIIEHMDAMPYVDSRGRVYRYGEFFPLELSPFAYNETIAQEYFPLTKDQAQAQGYAWRDPEEKQYTITLTNDQIPDHIQNVPESVLNEIIQCAHAQFGSLASKCDEQYTTAFRIIHQELEFLRKMNLPLPRLCPNCRHYQRLKQRNPLKLWHRQCTCGGSTSDNGVYRNTASHPSHSQDQHCPNEFETSYSPERKEIVYCEQCYQTEVA